MVENMSGRCILEDKYFRRCVLEHISYDDSDSKIESYEDVHSEINFSDEVWVAPTETNEFDSSDAGCIQQTENKCNNLGKGNI